MLPVRQVAAYPHTESEQPASPDWDDLRVLLSVVQTGSFGRTANALGLTQPTVSRRVARLEKLVGSKLVDRTHTGVSLTVVGQQVIEQLHVAHGAIDRIVNRTRHLVRSKETLTLLTTDGIAVYWLSRFLPFLFDTYPEIELRAMTGGDLSIQERPKFDLIIHFMQPNDPNLITVRLGTLHFMPFASPSYLLRYGRPRTPKDLAYHRLLDYSLYLIDKGTWLTRLPVVAERSGAQLFTNSSTTLAEAIRNGTGIGLIPTYGLVFEKGFEALDLEGLKFATPFWLCYPKETLTKQTARVAIDFLKHIFNRKTMPWFADQFVPPEMFPTTSAREIMATFTSTGTTESAVG